MTMPDNTFPTPLRALGPIEGYDVWFKDESVLAGGTFKDRLVARAVECSSRGTVLATISYGNTAYSLALELEKRANHGVRGYVLVPEDIEEWVLGPSTSGITVKGPDLLERLARTLTIGRIPVGGEVLDDAAVEQLVREALGGDVDRVVNITEGISEPCYRAIIDEVMQQMEAAPDFVIVPFGAGILCNEIVDYIADAALPTQVIPLSVVDRDSLARMLYGPIWVDIEHLAARGRALSRHASPDRTGAPRIPYSVHAVSDDEVRSGLERARSHGLSAEPSGSVGLGILGRLDELSPLTRPGARVVIIGTGNALDVLARELV
jgi:threonine dehydratase